MDREEFFKKIKDMGLHIEYDRYFLHILDKSNFELASISIVYKYNFRFFQAGFCSLSNSECADFINLVTDFVCSCMNRKDEKRYYLKHRFLQASSGYSFFSVNKYERNTYLSTYFQAGMVQTEFTQSEIEMMKKEYDTDFNDFEMIEVGEYNYENK